MSKKFIPKFLKITLITIGVVFVSLFFLLAAWGFFAIAGGSILVNQLFNEVVLQNHSDRTTLTSVNSTTNKLSSAADYTVDIPAAYKILHEEGFSSDPLSITLGNDTGEIKISRDSQEGKNLNDIFLNYWKISLLEEQPLNINGYEAVKARRSQDQYIYYIRITKDISKNNDWVFMISTENKNLLSDLDQIAQSFKYAPDN